MASQKQRRDKLEFVSLARFHKNPNYKFMKYTAKSQAFFRPKTYNQ